MSNQKGSNSEEQNQVESNASAVSEASDNAKGDGTDRGSLKSEVPDPFIEREPGDIITAMDWNNMQIQTREEIRSHGHTGKDGKQLSGEAIDPESEVTVKNLSVEKGFILCLNPLFAETPENQDKEAVKVLQSKSPGTFLIVGPCEKDDDSFRFYWKRAEESYSRFAFSQIATKLDGNGKEIEEK